MESINTDSPAPRSPYRVAEVECTECHHEQISIFPVGALWLECDRCHRQTCNACAVCDGTGLVEMCAPGSNNPATARERPCPVCSDPPDDGT